MRVLTGALLGAGGGLLISIALGFPLGFVESASRSWSGMWMPYCMVINAIYFGCLAALARREKSLLVGMLGLIPFFVLQLLGCFGGWDSMATVLNILLVAGLGCYTMWTVLQDDKEKP